MRVVSLRIKVESVGMQTSPDCDSGRVLACSIPVQCKSTDSQRNARMLECKVAFILILVCWFQSDGNGPVCNGLFISEFDDRNEGSACPAYEPSAHDVPVRCVRLARLLWSRPLHEIVHWPNPEGDSVACPVAHVWCPAKPVLLPLWCASPSGGPPSPEAVPHQRYPADERRRRRRRRHRQFNKELVVFGFAVLA